MSSNTIQPYMTSPARTGKMMAIMLGICIVGGAIFFGMWDYWISQPAPVVAMMAGEPDHDAPAKQTVAADPTGVSHDLALDFVESEDFRTLAFNALPGEENHNPEIRVNSGDEVTITATNTGMMPHTFGIVTDPDDLGSLVEGSAIGTLADAIYSGKEGTVTFTAGAPGTYHYVCTIPGHVMQGMQGSFIVE